MLAELRAYSIAPAREARQARRWSQNFLDTFLACPTILRSRGPSAFRVDDPGNHDGRADSSGRRSALSQREGQHEGTDARVRGGAAPAVRKPGGSGSGLQPVEVGQG